MLPTPVPVQPCHETQACYPSSCRHRREIASIQHETQREEPTTPCSIRQVMALHHRAQSVDRYTSKRRPCTTRNVCVEWKRVHTTMPRTPEHTQLLIRRQARGKCVHPGVVRLVIHQIVVPKPANVPQEERGQMRCDRVGSIGEHGLMASARTPAPRARAPPRAQPQAASARQLQACTY